MLFKTKKVNFKASETAPNSLYTIPPNIVFQQLNMQYNYAPI